MTTDSGAVGGGGRRGDRRRGAGRSRRRRAARRPVHTPSPPTSRVDGLSGSPSLRPRSPWGSVGRYPNTVAQIAAQVRAAVATVVPGVGGDRRRRGHRHRPRRPIDPSDGDLARGLRSRGSPAKGRPEMSLTCWALVIGLALGFDRRVPWPLVALAVVCAAAGAGRRGGGCGACRAGSSVSGLGTGLRDRDPR